MFSNTTMNYSLTKDRTAYEVPKWTNKETLWTEQDLITSEYMHTHYVVLSHLLKRVGEVAALSFSPSEEGFIVKTTWRLRITRRGEG